MPWLFFAGLVLLGLAFFYDPAIFLGRSNTFVKGQEKRPVWREAGGFIAIIFGLVLIVAFVLHLIQEIKWFFVLLTSIILLLMGFLFAGQRLGKIIQHELVKKSYELAEAFDVGLKKSITEKAVVIGLASLGVLAIIFAMVLDFS